MAMSSGRGDDEPMMEMNTTPLIDVMLVLLIMFIVTIPPQTHAVKVDLPQNQNTPPPPVLPDKNALTINPEGVVAWNGQPVTQVTLTQYLAASKALPVEPELHFEPDPQAKFEKVDQVLAVIKRSGITKLGFIGNERYGTSF
ncbi:ExbD/TolR family protein [uncultured Sphingomonas sp.]|uniref:ExbD/TolR family protein n=1 Tax=uncultured Sphingomonas sp. TaxID=158754 RepID=UPI0035C9945E